MGIQVKAAKECFTGKVHPMVCSVHNLCYEYHGAVKSETWKRLDKQYPPSKQVHCPKLNSHNGTMSQNNLNMHMKTVILGKMSLYPLQLMKLYAEIQIIFRTVMGI